jgi:molecular chaperone DnaK
MSRIKYGIDLGTTNSAIAYFDKGESVIVKNELQKDTTPSCISYTKKKSIIVGDRSYNQLNSDKLIALKKGKSLESNTYIEFKRTMGSDKKYLSSFMESEFTSEALSSEILMKLKSLASTDSIKSVVITIPAMFNDNQKSATLKAAQLAGFTQVELLQEPIAASIAYGVDQKVQDGKVLIFDFGGGTFDICYLKIDDGILQIKDTEGDNWLGGKNLDNAIVDGILMPYLQENYSIESYTNNELKNGLLKDALKVVAEQIKINMSNSVSFDVISNLDEYPNDDDGEEIVLDFTVTQDQINNVLTPVFQKAIDITTDVLKRNNLDGSSIDDLVLVGGPTFSPVLRRMLTDQICVPNTTVDPMTVVARGAAIYASQFDIDEAIKDEVRDETKIQLDLSYESQSVEEDTMLVVKLNRSKTSGNLPSKIFVNCKRNDGGWESNKIEIDETGDIVDLKLRSGKPNVFELFITNEFGENFSCEPSEITIIQGIKTGNATLAYGYGVEVLGENGKANFHKINGLEKGQTMPASGEISGLKTQKDLRPNTSDEINISIYQGTIDAQNTRAVNQTWVGTVKLTGNDIGKLLPKNSEVNLFLDIIRDGVFKLSIDVPYLNETIEKPFEQVGQKGEDDIWFHQQFAIIDKEIADFENNNENYDIERYSKIKENIVKTKEEFDSRKSDFDLRMQVRDGIRKQFAELDNLSNQSSWPTAEQDIKTRYYELETKVNSTDNEKYKSTLSEIKKHLDVVLVNKSVSDAEDLKGRISSLYLQILDEDHGVELYISILINYNDDFDTQPWIDKSKARNVLNSAMNEVMSNPSKERAISYCQQLWKLLPNQNGPTRDDILGS